MSKFAQSLNSEIARIAKRTVNAELATLRKSVSAQRALIAALNRKNVELSRHVSALQRAIQRRSTTDEDIGAKKLRFRADGFAAHRQRLGLSAEDYGKLLGVSPITVYKWEGGTKPRAKYLPKIDEVRKLGKRQATARLAELA